MKRNGLVRCSFRRAAVLVGLTSRVREVLEAPF